MNKKYLLTIIITGVLITSMVIYKAYNDKTKESINTGAIDYVVEESEYILEEQTAVYSSEFTEEETEIQSTVEFRVEIPETASISASPIAGGVTYDTYDEEELLIAEYFTSQGYSNFLIIKGSMIMEDGTGLELPEWLYAYTDSVNNYYSLLLEGGNSVYAIYVNGEVIYKEE